MSKENLLDVSVFVITFDEYIKLDFSNLQDGEYKESREKLLKNVEDLMNHLVENDQEQWKDILTSNDLRIEEKSFCIKHGRPTLIILDDNMFFRSMRQQIRRICKRLNCKHFQVYFKISIDEAMKQNRQRLHQIPESVIHKMHQRLEVPTNQRTLVVDSNTSSDEIATLINDRIENPETFAELETADVELKQSIIHELDIFTRRELNMRIKGLQSSPNLSTTCSQLNQKRKEFLKSLKTRVLDLDENLVEPLRVEFIELLNLSQ